MDIQKAVKHLRKADPVMADIIKRVGPCTLWPQVYETHFDALVRSIIYQQLSGKAAATIHQRFKDHFGGRTPLPAEVLETDDDVLRGLGLSRQKLTYIKDFASKIDAGEVPIDRLHEQDDDAIIAELTKVKGIGRWTVQMFLMFRLRRPDVLPDLDLGIQKAIKIAYGLEEMPKPKQVLEIGAKWSPYRTIAGWYLWRSIDGEAN